MSNKTTSTTAIDKLVRTGIIMHPQGIQLETPLLVPSFSSKGFSLNKKEESEATDALKVSSEFLTETMLLSAYDLHHKHIPYDPELLCTDVTFIDSGGYETSEVYDLSATTKYNYPIKDWTLDNYKDTISQWPEYKAGIIVSYDHGKERFDLENQIIHAKDLFSKYPHFSNDFLIKPETEDQRYIPVKDIIDKITILRDFPIIGMTEKELGNSILKRMVNIAKIRIALDHAGIDAPIHIFGSLDPITSLLYFIVGAEIFDGLTWLKYSYYQGSAIYQSNFGALHDELGIHVRDDQVRLTSVVKNLYCLEKMKYIMKDFSVSNNDFSVFNNLNKGLGDFLKKCYITFQSNLK